MRKIQVSTKCKYAGEYEIYEEGELGAPLARRDYDKADVGDWILSSDGIIAQVLGIQENRNGDKILVTAFGLDSIVGNHRRRGLNLLRNRTSFWRLTDKTYEKREQIKKLTVEAKFFLIGLVKSGPDQALNTYLKVFPRRRCETVEDKYAIRKQIGRILNHPEANEFIMKTVAETLTDHGETTESWITKLVESRGDKIETEVQRKMHMTIGLMIPGIRKELSGKELEGEGGQRLFPLPSQVQQIEDAVSVDVTNDAVEDKPTLRT